MVFSIPKIDATIGLTIDVARRRTRQALMRCHLDSISGARQPP
jgi:hypothetical protein